MTSYGYSSTHRHLLAFSLLTMLDLTSFFAPGYFATRGVTLARL